MANLIEIFSSIQGEGKYVGCRQIFIRLAECNLNCAYCDTIFKRADFCLIETAAGSMTFEQIKNPFTAAQVALIIKQFNNEVPTHSVSFTGGEPLLRWKFIRSVAEKIKSTGLKIFLETNGTLPAELSQIIDFVDIISMDIKLPSVAGNYFDKHREFLKIAAQKDLYAKIVISAETTAEEFDTAINLIAEVSPEILLILQPVTAVKNVQAIPARRILELQAAASRKLKNVRVIPQTHKLLYLL
ncbi:MAG: 7-carboxy-7-deazaguanine synthase QueE [Selenomonadaceae bacterium]|nr:7-carboxy-7-deazaguanine synthase QueE [Selenomonadaceae bacterium]